MRKVPAAQFVTGLEALEMPLPAQSRRRRGDLVGAARDANADSGADAQHSYALP
jgi:hypothetical protein